MSIAEQQKEINQVINASKQRLRTVDQKLEMLSNQKLSIDQDISILSQRLQVIKDRLSGKKKALETITSLAAETDDAYRKLKDSSKLLLASLKKQSKKIDMLAEYKEDDDN